MRLLVSKTLNIIKTLFFFSDAPFVGCEFYFKQALRRQLIGVHHIDESVVSELMGEDGHINILFVLPHDEIVSTGIPYVRSKTREEGYFVQFTAFWNDYFVSTWMIRYGPST